MRRRDAAPSLSQPLAEGTVWTLRIASQTTRLDAGDPLLRHKTTRATAYDAARAEFPPRRPTR